MRKLVLLGASLSVIFLTGCGDYSPPTQEEVVNQRIVLRKQCHDSGGKYILTRPEGYVSASYWCIWDEQ